MSGGPDSLGLLLAAAGAGHGRTVHVATVDHGWRPEAATEAAFVGRLAATLGLPHRTLTWRPDKAAGGNLQDRARSARYALLSAEARRVGAGAVLTAHHADDQIETHLLARVRGTTGAGLAGMRPWRDLEPGVVLLRPFLDREPAALAEAVRAAGWQAVDDPSNRDTRFARVRLRGRIEPRERRVARDALREAAGLRRAADEHLRATIEAHASAGTLRIDTDGAASIGTGIDALDDALLSRLLVAVGGALHPPSRDAVSRLREALATQPRATVSGCLVARRKMGLYLRREFGRTGPTAARAGEDGIALFDRRFQVGPLAPGTTVVAAAGEDVTGATRPAILDADGARSVLPLREIEDGPADARPRAVSTVSWRLWADLAGPIPERLTERPQIAAKRASPVGKV